MAKGEDTDPVVEIRERVRGGVGYHSLSGEKKLYLAVLEEAFRTYQKHVLNQTEKKAAFGEAEAWIRSGDRESPFSFLNICEIHGLDPGYLRSGLSAWRRRKIAQRLELQQNVSSDAITRQELSV